MAARHIIESKRLEMLLLGLSSVLLLCLMSFGGKPLKAMSLTVSGLCILRASAAMWSERHNAV
jgi:hypothetical protein